MAASNAARPRRRGPAAVRGVAKQIHQPPDDEYRVEAWSRVLFSGDVFEAIPFGAQPILTDSEAEPAKHYRGEIAFGYAS